MNILNKFHLKNLQRLKEGDVAEVSCNSSYDNLIGNKMRTKQIQTYLWSLIWFIPSDSILLFISLFRSTSWDRFLMVHACVPINARNFSYLSFFIAQNQIGNSHKIANKSYFCWKSVNRVETRTEKLGRPRKNASKQTERLAEMEAICLYCRMIFIM